MRAARLQDALERLVLGLHWRNLGLDITYRRTGQGVAINGNGTIVGLMGSSQVNLQGGSIGFVYDVYVPKVPARNLNNLFGRGLGPGFRVSA
jgi:hypothetical protein